MTLTTARCASLALVCFAGTGCFNPEGGQGDSETDTDVGSTGTGMSSSPTGSPSSGMTADTTASGTASTTSPPTSTTEPTTTETTTQDTETGTTGEPSDCPGGDPTPGEAPYILSTVIAEQGSDDVDLGDIDGDGHLDIINLSTGEGAVETFFGDGTGGFMSDGVTVLHMNGFPDTVRLGAIADDTVDLFVHMEGPVELWVVRGDGAGNWPSPQVYDGTYVRAIDLADFNGDDVLDLAYVGASNLEVRLGVGLTESYDDPALYGANFGSVVRIADITGDGELDILTADFSSTELEIYSGNGDGTFQAETTVVVGSAISGIDAGLLDNDDNIDLVLTTADDLRVFYGMDAGGVSSTPGTIIDNALDRVRVADIDADGIGDLITRSGSDIEIRFSQGNTTFSDPEGFACPEFVRRVVVGDLNEDCVPDLVASGGNDPCVLISDRD